MSHEKFSLKILSALQTSLNNYSGEIDLSDEQRNAVMLLFKTTVEGCQKKPVQKRAKTAYQCFVLDPVNRKRIEDASDEKIEYKRVVSLLAKEWKVLADKSEWETKADEERQAMPTVEKGRKRARTAYNFFVSDSRGGSPTDQNPSERMKDLAAKWKDLDEEARAPFELKATEERARFVTKAPERKRARSGYNFFVQDGTAKKALLEDDPTLKPTEIMALLGKHWSSMDSDEKAPFETLATQDRADIGIVVKAPVQRKRARSAYQFWKDSEDTRQALQEQFPEKSIKDILKDMKVSWELLPLHDKVPWETLSTRERDTINLQIGKVSLERSTSLGAPPDLSSIFT